MDNVKVVFSDGTEILAAKGSKLSDIIKSGGYPMDFPCGGVGKCGQCKVEAALLQGNGGEPKDIFEALSCAYNVEKDLWVRLPAGLDDRGTIILTSGTISTTALEPAIEKKFLAGQNLTKNEVSYWTGLEEVAKGQVGIGAPELKVLQQFSGAVARAKGGDITVVSSEGHLIGVEGGDTSDKCYGLAIDIGTTTVVGYLTDLLTGTQLAVGAELNGQRVFGADVISRITAAQKSNENLTELQSKVIATINQIIATVVKDTGINPEEIYSITLAGNTCMHHLALGLNPSNLGRAPFLPIVHESVVISGGELGLAANANARIWVFPVIAGFVGGDTVAAILASDLHQEKGTKLLIDIGTNGELVINAHGRMAACSAAAGPALEGAQIAFGMRAEKGAISRVVLSPEIKLEIIGGGPVKGICGSGLIDLLGEMVKAGLINKNGGIVKPDHYTGPDYLKERLRRGEHGFQFVLVKADENQGKEILLTQDDVMQLQLAKGAIRAAIELLVKKVGIQGEEVEEILLAGAFGNFLDIENAHTIGLLPGWGRGRVRSIGNAAGEGAKLALLSNSKRKEAELINEQVEFLELAGTSEFQEAFIQGMLF